MNRTYWIIFILFLFFLSFYLTKLYNKRKYLHKVDISGAKKTNFRLYKDVEEDSHKILKSYTSFWKKTSIKSNYIQTTIKNSQILPLLIISSIITAIIRKEIDKTKPKVYRVIQGTSHEYLGKIKKNPMLLPLEKQKLFVYKLVKSTIGNEINSQGIKSIFQKHFKELYSKYVPY